MASRHFRGWLPFFLLALGLVCAYATWVLDHPDQDKWVARIIGPTGTQALETYDNLVSGAEITSSSPGFRLVSRLVARKVLLYWPSAFLPGEEVRNPYADLIARGSLAIHKMKAAGRAWSPPSSEGEGSQGLQIRGLQLTYSLYGKQQESNPVDIPGFRDELETTFIGSPLYRWSWAFVVVGLVISFFSAVLAARQEARTPSVNVTTAGR